MKGALEDLPASLRARLLASGVLKGADVAAATTKALPRFQPGRWLPHFEKHAAEFGYRTPVEYLKGARDLVGRSGIQTFTRANGDKLYYDAARNEFAVMKPDGVRGPTSGRRTAPTTGWSRSRNERRPRAHPGASATSSRGLLGEDSLGALLRRWSELVTQVERGYDDSIYEYTNDLAVRGRLDEVVAAAGPGLRAKLEGALAEDDRRFTAATEEAARPLGRSRVGAPRADAPRRRAGGRPRVALSSAGEPLRLAQGGAHAARVGDAAAGDVERRAVVDARADHRQADGDVDASSRPRTLTGPWPWSWYIATTRSKSPRRAGRRRCRPGAGPRRRSLRARRPRRPARSSPPPRRGRTGRPRPRAG